MSSVPPNIVGPLLQSGLASRQIAGERDKDANAQRVAARETAKLGNAAETSVETTDGDTRIHADAEGAGGQGRSLEEEEQQREEANTLDIVTDEETEDADQNAADDDHLDIQA